MKEKNNMTNQNTTINTTTAIQYDNDAEKLSCHYTLPGGGFHTDDENDTLPGGCIHGTGQADEQKETLPEGAW